MDGLTLSGVKQLLEAQEDSAEGFITLKGCSGRIWGAVSIISEKCLYFSDFDISPLITVKFFIRL